MRAVTSLAWIRSMVLVLGTWIGAKEGYTHNGDFGLPDGPRSRIWKMGRKGRGAYGPWCMCCETGFAECSRRMELRQ